MPSIVFWTQLIQGISHLLIGPSRPEAEQGVFSLLLQAVFMGSSDGLVEAADSVSLIWFFCSKEGPGRLDSRCMEPVTNSCQRKGAGPADLVPRSRPASCFTKTHTEPWLCSGRSCSLALEHALGSSALRARLSDPLPSGRSIIWLAVRHV